jgi:endonuclease/exonuclease/phosphatase family metal-dependent hydrolase
MDSLLKVLPIDQVIVAGDFNTLPESVEIQKISRILKNTDNSNAPTWTVYIEGCPQCNTKLYSHRLDNIFVSRDIKIISSKVGSSKGSDHLPVVTTISI